MKNWTRLFTVVATAAGCLAAVVVHPDDRGHRR